MSTNFVPLTAQDLVARINKIPRVNLALLPTVLEFAPNISKELDINLFTIFTFDIANYWYKIWYPDI